MDFIERWFGIFPDSGEGFTEALVILAAIGLLLATVRAILLVLERRRPATLKIRTTARRRPRTGAPRDPSS